MLNLRPSCASYAAGMKSPSKRSTRLQQAGALRPKGPWPKHLTYLDHGVETEAQRALRPRCPAGKKRSTPTARRVSSGRRAYHSNRRTCPEGEGLITPTHWTRPRTKGLSLRPSARAACEGLNHFALAAFPRGRPCGTTRAEGLTPRFLGRETLEKPDNDLSITPIGALARVSGPRRPKCSIQFSLVQKNLNKSLVNAVLTPNAATSATGRGSEYGGPTAAAPASPAPSGCRRAPSFAS